MNRNTTIRTALALALGLSLGALSQPADAKPPKAKWSGIGRTFAASPRINRSSTVHRRTLNRVSGSGVPGRTLNRVSGSGVPGRTLNRVSGSGVPGRTLNRVSGSGVSARSLNRVFGSGVSSSTIQPAPGSGVLGRPANPLARRLSPSGPTNPTSMRALNGGNGGNGDAQRLPTIGNAPADRNVTFPVPTPSVLPTIGPIRESVPKISSPEVVGETPEVRLPRGEVSAPPPPQLPETPVIRQQAPPEMIPYGDDNRQPPPTNLPPVDTTRPPWLPPLPPFGGTSPSSLPPAEGNAPPLDTATEALATAPADLKVLEVRFVDPGFSSRKLGPRYRITFINDSSVAIEAPFQVTLAADNGRRPTASAKFTTQQVDRIEAGGLKSVDIRLPIEALEMGRDNEDQPAPFSTLMAILDSHENLVETDEQNNTAVLNRTEVKEVDPQMFQTDVDTVRAGSSIIVLGEGFGPKAGKVEMEMSGLKFEAQIIEWHHLGLRIELPALPLSKAVDMKCTLVREDGRWAKPIALKMEPAKPSS